MNARLSRSLVVLFLFGAGMACAAESLLPNPSLEQPKPKDRWGFVVNHRCDRWGEGQREFRVSDLAHRGKHSLLIMSGTQEEDWSPLLIQLLTRLQVAFYTHSNAGARAAEKYFHARLGSDHICPTLFTNVFEESTDMNTTKMQMELGFDRPAAPLARMNHSGRRLARARWWFEQMHAVVDKAFDWSAAPAPRPEQICLALSKAR
jgi:hypothetical protein